MDYWLLPFLYDIDVIIQCQIQNGYIIQEKENIFKYCNHKLFDLYYFRKLFAKLMKKLLFEESDFLIFLLYDSK